MVKYIRATGVEYTAFSQSWPVSKLPMPDECQAALLADHSSPALIRTILADPVDHSARTGKWEYHIDWNYAVLPALAGVVLLGIMIERWTKPRNKP